MPLIAKEPAGNFDDQPFEMTPEGLTPGICYAIFDLGTHASEYQGTVKDRHKIAIIWELPKHRIEVDGVDKPKAISRTFTLSLHEKSALRSMLESWRDKSFTPEELGGFDIEKLLGIPCQIQVIHNPSKTDPNKKYANIKNVLPPADGMNGVKPENPTAFFSFEDGMELPETTPEWIRGIIMDSREWSAVPAELRDDPTAVKNDQGEVLF